MKFTGNPWTLSSWHKRVHNWIRAQLAHQAMAITGEIEQPHIRPWSTVLRIPTADGDVYFKAVNPNLKHEIVVTEALVGWFPEWMPRVYAFEREQGWMLMPDGGTRFREVNRAEQDLGRWEQILGQYAELQMGLAEQVPTLLALGAPDCRPTELAAAIATLLADKSALLLDQKDGLTGGEYERLLALRPRIHQLGEQLANAGIPPSLNHGDLHDANIFLNDEQPTFFDWGDCSVAHPFFSLRTVFVNIEYIFDLPENAPPFTRLRDAYLEPWSRLAPPRQLEPIFNLSRQLAPLCGALRWYQAINLLPPKKRGEYAAAIPSLFQEFLDLQAD